MKYYAKLNADNLVLGVHCVSEDDAPNEETGIAFLSKVHKWNMWKRTYKTTAEGIIRVNPAVKGGTYDSENDRFLDPKPYPSWVLDANFKWVAPIDPPADLVDKSYDWDEDTQSWIELTGE